MNKLTKRILSIVLVLVLIAIAFYFEFRPKRLDPTKYLADEKGNTVLGPNGTTYLPYSGEPGTITEGTETGETVYYISGVWLWNEELVMPEQFGDGITKIAKITFSSAKKQETSVIYAQTQDGFSLHYSDYYDGRIYLHGLGWTDASGRVMDCGMQPQQITKELADFLAANATPATKEAYTQAVVDYVDGISDYTLSGYWVWNRTISMPADARRIKIYELYGKNAEGMEFYGFDAYPTYLEVYLTPISEDGFRTTNYWDSSRDTQGSPWTNEKDRYIYLGEDPQTVYGEAYAYFIANAKPCTKAEFDAMAAKDDSETLLSGRYVGRYLWDWRVEEDNGRFANGWEAEINFESNGKTFTVMRGAVDEETGSHYIQYGNDDELITVYSYDTGWVDSAYRTVDFGTKAQYVLCKPDLVMTNRMTPIEETDQSDSSQ